MSDVLKNMESGNSPGQGRTAVKMLQYRGITNVTTIKINLMSTSE